MTIRSAPLLVAALTLLACDALISQSGPVPPAPMARSAPRLDDWRILSPGGGGAMYNPLPSPHDKSTILVSTDMTGCYLSQDGGESWRMFYLRWTCNFAYDPKSPEILYAAAGPVGLYRSQDRGKTWQLLFPEPGAVSKLYTYDDEAEQMLFGRLDGRAGLIQGVTAVAVHPEDSNTLYVAAGSTLWISKNAGKSWKNAAAIMPQVRRIWIDPRPGVAVRKVFLQGSLRFGYFDDSFHEVALPGKLVRVLSSVVSFTDEAADPVIVLAINDATNRPTRTGLLVTSSDLGNSWQECWQPLAALGKQGGSAPSVRAIGGTPANPNVLYASFAGIAARGGEALSFGVARSDDGGKSYRLVWEEIDKPAANINDPWLSDVYGPDWGEHPLNIAVHPKDPDYVVTTDLGRTMKTMDGGKTWQGLYAKRVDKDRWTTTGLDVTNCYGIHFDPFAKGRLLASCTDLGLLLSEDRGATWRSSWTGIPKLWRNTMYWTQFDPEVPGVVWGAASRLHDLPRARIFRNMKPENFQGGMVQSRDGGKTWAVISEGLPKAPITHFVVDWKSPKEGRTLWAAGMFRGVYRSTDGGRSWELRASGLPSGETALWRLHLDASGRLYVVLAQRSPKAEPGTNKAGGIFSSDDRGETWQAVKIPDGVLGPTDIYSDPQNADRLYFTAWPRYEPAAPPAKTAGGGLYLSTDRGKSWRTLLPDNLHMYSVSADPAHPGRMYAAGFTSALFRSDDNGQSWHRIRGLNFRLGHRVVPDPLDPAMIYVATMGGGIWYGPADGSAESVSEDITAPPHLRFDTQYPRVIGK